jgi:hypothetical protein
MCGASAVYLFLLLWRFGIMAAQQTDWARLDTEIEGLTEEFSRLESVFAQQLKAAGLKAGDLQAIDVSNPPPALKAQIEAARQAAKRAGEERAGQFRAQTAPASGGSGAHRPGALKL